MAKKRYDPQGRELPPYIYWNKRARRYEVRAYVGQKELKVGHRFFSSLEKAIEAQKRFIMSHKSR